MIKLISVKILNSNPHLINLKSQKIINHFKRTKTNHRTINYHHFKDPKQIIKNFINPNQIVR